MYTTHDLAEEGDDADDYYWSFYSLYHSDDAAAVDVGGYITELSPDGFTREYGGYKLPAKYVFMSALRSALPLISAVFILWGLISVTGCLMHWKMSILSKQLFMTLPLVIGMAAIITISLLGSIRDEYLTQSSPRMEAIIELSVRSLDGDAIEQMKSLDCTNDGSLYDLCEEMRELIGSNAGDRNSKYYGNIFLYGSDGMHFMLASGDSYDMPFILSTYDGDEPIDYSYTSIYYTESFSDIYICADAPIFNSKGELVAFYELQANTSDLTDDINSAFREALIRIAILIPAFIAAAAFITYISAGYLRKVKSAVATIANGDFSARIEGSPNDEIGEICTGVNEMARQLEGFFNTKDRNERFYYKFVPEKFRELLHKNEFTDLSLGDAENADLTVLFCDIRAFSLNSEMMT
ncbi:MAG: HAMP domain-containing protein, partial [Oscillospiraceae bacterium]